MAENNRMKITVEVDPYQESQIADQTARLVADHARQVAEDVVREAVSQAVDNEVERITSDIVEAEVRAAMAEGWQKTNSYGEPQGGKVTLRDRITAVIEARDYNRQGKLDRLVEELVRDAIRTEVKAELDAARAKFRAAIDDELIAKFRDMLRKSVGIDL